MPKLSSYQVVAIACFISVCVSLILSYRYNCDSPIVCLHVAIDSLII